MADFRLNLVIIFKNQNNKFYSQIQILKILYFYHLKMNTKYADYLEEGFNQNNYAETQRISDLVPFQTNPESQFTITFGKQDKQFINHLFCTPPIAIHSRRQTHGTIGANPNFNLMSQDTKNTKTQSSLDTWRKDKWRRGQIQRVKENISKLTYSIKTIQSRTDQEIGVTSKRVLMGLRNLQTQRSALNTQHNRARCKSSSNFIIQSSIDNSLQGYENQDAKIKNLKIIPHSRFFSKRLNVFKKKLKEQYKQNQAIFNQKNNQICQIQNKSFTLFDFNNDNQNKQSLFKSDCRDNANEIPDCFLKSPSPTLLEDNFRSNTIHIKEMNSSKFKISNKKLNLQNLQFRKKIKEQKQNINLDDQRMKPIFIPTSSDKVCKNIVSVPGIGTSVENRKKVSLSKFLGQYQTQIIQISNNLLLQKNKNNKPLQIILKSLSSGANLPKRSENSSKQSEKNVISQKIMRINKALNLKVHQYNVEANKNGDKQTQISGNFKRYNEIQKENFIE